MTTQVAGEETPRGSEPAEVSHAKALVEDVLDGWKQAERMEGKVDQIALANQVIDTLVEHGLTIPGDWARHNSPFHGEARAVAVQEGDSDV